MEAQRQRFGRLGHERSHSRDRGDGWVAIQQEFKKAGQPVAIGILLGAVLVRRDAASHPCVESIESGRTDPQFIFARSCGFVLDPDGPRKRLLWSRGNTWDSELQHGIATVRGAGSRRGHDPAILIDQRQGWIDVVRQSTGRKRGARGQPHCLAALDGQRPCVSTGSERNAGRSAEGQRIDQHAS